MTVDSTSPFSPPKANLEGGVAVAGDRALAPSGTRLAAVLLDGLVSLPAAIPLWIGMFLNASAKRTGEEAGTGAAVAMGVGVLLLLAIVVYQIYLLSTEGQTLGKRWMKVRVTSLDGSNPGFVRVFLLRAVVNGLLGVIPFYGLVDILFIFAQDQRCLHDKIAGTRVVLA